VHFLWKPSNKYFNYFQLGQLKSKKVAINHLEYHQSITTKNNLYKNLDAYCQVSQYISRKINLKWMI